MKKSSLLFCLPVAGFCMTGSALGSVIWAEIGDAPNGITGLVSGQHTTGAGPLAERYGERYSGTGHPYLASGTGRAVRDTHERYGTPIFRRRSSTAPSSTRAVREEQYGRAVRDTHGRAVRAVRDTHISTERYGGAIRERYSERYRAIQDTHISAERKVSGAESGCLFFVFALFLRLAIQRLAIQRLAIQDTHISA
jgi:hypothetical protein